MLGLVNDTTKYLYSLWQQMNVEGTRNNASLGGIAAYSHYLEWVNARNN